MWTSEDEELFSKAIESKDAGHLSASRDIFLELVRRNPENAGLRWSLGHIYWRLGDLDMAIDSFREASKTSPGSERASLGLFHCLWDQGRRIEAFEEAKRFMAISESEDYKEIINEINSRPMTLLTAPPLTE
jgi:tetratricopeptide (TPR) repeat protein